MSEKKGKTRGNGEAKEVERLNKSMTKMNDEKF